MCAGGGELQGMDAPQVTVYDYQALCDNGWRRSGSYLYRPDNRRMCCPQYTIRLPVSHFKLDKHHKQVKRKWHKWMMQGDAKEQPTAQQSKAQSKEQGKEQGKSEGKAVVTSGASVSGRRRGSSSAQVLDASQQMLVRCSFTVFLSSSFSSVCASA